MGWIVLVVLVVLVSLVIRFTRVNEGTARALMVFGEFSKIIFRWRDHWMDTEWNVWRMSKPGEKLEPGSKRKEKTKVWSQKIFGGLCIYFWPFQKIHRYKHRWTDIRLKDSKMEVEFHEEDLYHVLLKPAVYSFKLTAVETKPPERIPVNVLVLVTLRIRNPYLFLFVAPPTPVEDILARISAETRALVTSCQIDELLQLRGKSFWELLKGAKVIEKTLEKWGVKIAKKGIEIQEIDLSPEYQKAAAAKKEEEMKAAGRAEEIMGTVITSVARAEGRSESEIQEEFRQNPEEFYRKHKTISDNTMTKLSMEERSYLRIETPGAEGGLGDFLRLIGAWQRMPMGRPAAEERAEREAKTGERKEEKEEEEKEEKLTEDEREVIAEAKKRGVSAKESLEKWRQWKKKQEEKKKKRKEKWGF